MKLKLFRKETIQEFADKHANARKHFENFLSAMEYADWNEPLDICKAVNGNLLGNGSDRVVFDLGGNGRNAFRVICKYKFRQHKNRVYLYVVWIGSHEEYNALSLKDKLTAWEY
jgi:mRNA-degrading endonuclease HigB of HigAB toxin-antitoxin module